jgi:AraC-like DNA-binding protein
MIYLEDENPSVDEPGGADTGSAVIRTDPLRKFKEVVRSLGGDPAALLTKSHLDAAIFDNGKAVISHRAMVNLLERAAVELKCPDFGMRLASAEDITKVLYGPLGLAMRNSRTVGEAYRFCAGHAHIYCPALRMSIDEDRVKRRALVRFEFLLARMPCQSQAVELALLQTQHMARSISSGQVQGREIWFTHEPIAPLSVYRAHFGATVRFNQSSNAIIFNEADLNCPIADPDPELYEIATSYIDYRYPATKLTVTAHVRSVVARLLVDGDCTSEAVALALGIHPRTLQRRLREEGQSFETIRDDVRRDAALRYLRQPGIPLNRVAQMLGYSESAVFSRSCTRWFSSTPRKLRRELTAPSGESPGVA